VPVDVHSVEWQASLRDKLRAARATQQAEQIEEITIPGYDGQLVAKYRTLDWKERRAIGLNVKGPNIAVKELDAAADLIVASCVGVDAHVDGQVAPIEADGQQLKLGKKLANELGFEGADTDRQAVFQIFPSEIALMNHVGALARAQLITNEQIDDDLAGN